MQARPPFVEFKQVPVEDRNASIEAGHIVYRDVNYAFIMQPGSRDQVEKNAEEWLAQIKRQAIGGGYPSEWSRAFEQKYKDFLDGIEGNLDGTSLKMAPFVSPASVANYFSKRVFTIEDLAALNEEGLAACGMGSRADRDKAREWLASSSTNGKTAERIVALEAENNTLKEQLEGLQRRLVAIEDKPHVGRPKKVEE